MGDFFLDLLLQTHISSTLNNPITANQVQFKNFRCVSNEQELKTLSDESFQKFSETDLFKMRGSVHLNPLFWTSVVV